MAPFSGGMEHQTMTTQGFFNKGLTAHELGHQWWGDHVTCASWCDIWINEGFASYSEYLMLENLYPNEADGHMEDVHNNVMSQNGGSVWVLDSLNENRIFSGRLTYDKGAAIVHSMRYMINDDNQFFQILRDFQNTFADGTAYGVDFKNALESASGIDFTPFFEQWYFGQGYPTYSIQWQQSVDNLFIEINHSTSKPNITPTFTNDIDVEFQRIGLPDTTIRFSVNSNSELYTISNIGQITGSITIDPENWIINANGSISETNTLNSEIDLTGNSNLYISPNPSDGIFRIHNLNTKAEITVRDMKGKIRKRLLLNSGEFINIKDLGQGTYLIDIQLYNGTKRMKIVHF